MESDWLYSLGCAIGRGRAKGVREYIDGEILFEYEDHGRMTEMFIPMVIFITSCWKEQT